MNSDRPTLIIDTGIGDVHAAFREAYSHIGLTTLEPPDTPDMNGGPYHPHSGMVLSVYASNFTHRRDVVSVRNLTAAGSGQIEKTQPWILDVIRDVKPARIIYSQGAADGDSDLQQLYLDLMFTDAWINEFLQALEDADATLFAAAGNSDANDKDLDIDYPQRKMVDSDRVIVCGACDYRGIPAKFSGDGPGLAGMWIGVRRATMRADSGIWEAANGTSFAAPDAAGDSDAVGLLAADYLSRVRSIATYPPEFKDKRPHKKAGWGAMVNSTQANLIETGIFPLVPDSVASWHDFRSLGSWPPESLA